MPWESKKQQRWGHTDAAKEKGFTPDKVKEFDDATKGKKIPEAASKKADMKPHRHAAIKALHNLSKVPGKAQFQGDDIRNDQVPTMLSPGEGVVPRSVMQHPMVQKFFQHMAEGGVVQKPSDDPMAELLAGPETTDEYAKQRMEESKKYKKAKPGDRGVVSVGFDDEGKTKDIPVPHMADGGEVPQMEPGLMGAIRSWLSAKGDEGSRGVAEEVNKKLPRFLSGRDAVEKKREQLRKLDENTKD